jgi:tetratricopeptide (TPR) repeat protein
MDRSADIRLSDDDADTVAVPPKLPYGPARVALDLAVRRLDAAEQQREPVEMTEALAGLSRCYRSMAAWSPALDYMQQALRWAHVAGSAPLRVDLLCELAELAVSTADAILAPEGPEARAAHECARDHAFEAARMAVHAADAQWEIQVLLRVSDVLDRCGDHDDAITLQTRALTLISQHPDRDTAPQVPQVAAPSQLM